MNEPVERTVIVDLRIPFWRLVVFFIKSVFASVVAGIVIGVVFMAIGFALTMIFGGSPMDLMMRRWGI